MTEDGKPRKWLKSDEARRVLKVSACDLMHLRQAGKLRHEKAGNAFLYDARDVGEEAKRGKR